MAKASRIRATALTALDYIPLAKRLTSRYAKGRGVQYAEYDGVLFRFNRRTRRIITDIIVLPVIAWGARITSRDTDRFINGRAVHIREQQFVRFSRDVFRQESDADSFSPLDDTVELPEAFAFGEPMPEGTPSASYTGVSGRKVEGYTAIRSSYSFDSLVSGENGGHLDAPTVSPDTKFWVELVMSRGGKKFTRMTFSEDWITSFVPAGHQLVSRSTAYRVTLGFNAAASNGQHAAISFQLFKPEAPFDKDTNNSDSGVCSVLTVYLTLENDDGNPEVIWTHFWDREAQNDLRIAPYKFWPEPNYDPDDYANPPRTGYMHNTAIPTLEMNDAGFLFGVRVVSTMLALPNWRADDYNYDETGVSVRPVHGQLTYYTEWDAGGQYVERLISSNTNGGRAFYNQVVDEPNIPQLAREEMLLFLEAYNVDEEPNNQSFGYRAFNPGEVSLGEDSTGTYTLLVSTEYFKSYVDPNTGDFLDVRGNRAVSGDSRTTVFLAHFPTNGTPTVTQYNSGDTDLVLPQVKPDPLATYSIVGLDDDGLSALYLFQNLLPRNGGYVGGGVFMLNLHKLSTDTFVTARITPDILSVKSAPSDAGESTTAGDQVLKTIRYELPPEEEGGSPIPSVLISRTDTGVYISNDGAESWVRVFEDPAFLDAAYLSNSARAAPYDKASPDII